MLSTGLTAVIAEGDFEPRSIGSYSIRIYEANLEYPTDYFLYGTIRPREGNIETVTIQDINEDSIEEIIVVIRSVGTGSYLSADAFQCQSKKTAQIDCTCIGSRKDSRSYKGSKNNFHT